MDLLAGIFAAITLFFSSLFGQVLNLPQQESRAPIAETEISREVDASSSASATIDTTSVSEKNAPETSLAEYGIYLSGAASGAGSLDLILVPQGSDFARDYDFLKSALCMGEGHNSSYWCNSVQVQDGRWESFFPRYSGEMANLDLYIFAGTGNHELLTSTAVQVYKP